jgi:hypothetical protein
MRRFHLMLGTLLLVAFVMTGQYMDKVHAHLAGMADGPRLLYRSRHIYVLLTALVNLALGAHARGVAGRQNRVIQMTGSAAVAAASAAMVVAFFYDAPHANFEHLNLWWSRGAIYSLAGGVALHVIGGTLRQQPQPTAGAERASL